MKHLMTWLQSNHYPGSFKRSVDWLLRIIACGFCIWFIFEKTRYENLNLPSFVSKSDFLWVILLVFGMMLVNWFLEAERWRISLPGEALAFREALRAVLAGLAMNWVIPFTLGDAGGRLANVKSYKKGLFALMINRGILMLITSLYGAISVLFYLKKLNSFTFLGVIVGGFLIAFLYIKFNWEKVRNAMPNAIVIKIFQLSFLRYIVFSVQFYWLISFFIPSLAVSIVVLGIGWVFLFRSFVPSLFGNFGVREASALVFFEPYVEDVRLIVLPCMLIWLINTVIPSLAGALSILKLKINIAQ